MAEGDVLRAPGTWGREEPAEKEILASMAHLHQKGVTLKEGQGFLSAGTPIAPDSDGLFVAAEGGEDGTAAHGVLRLSVNTGGADSHRKLANIVLSGVVKVDALPGDSAAARLTAAQAVATALGGRVDEHRRELHY